MMRRGRQQRVLLLMTTALLLACGGGSGEPIQEVPVREAIEQRLSAYLEALSEAYASGNTDALQGLAAAKEIASVESRMVDLANEGRRLKASLQNLTIEDVTTWNRVNAFVTTHEVWDLQVLATGSETVLSEVQDQANRVKYQLKREDGAWRVLYRAIQE